MSKSGGLNENQGFTSLGACRNPVCVSNLHGFLSRTRISFAFYNRISVFAHMYKMGYRVTSKKKVYGFDFQALL
jgi:hypothetical protein